MLPLDQATPGLNLSLKQPPRWLRRPVSASFGFSGKLVTVSNLPGAHGKTQSSVVHIRVVSSEETVVARVKKLRAAAEDGDLEGFAQRSVGEQSGVEETWKALLSLFRSNSREELVTLLGYSKEEVKARIEEAAAKLKEARAQQTAYNVPALSSTADEEPSNLEPRDPVVSFVDPEPEPEVEATDTEKTGSEISASDTPPADGESTTTAPSLFGDDAAAGPFAAGTGADFFSTMGQDTHANDTRTMVVPHTNYGIDSSVAATIGSGPSSVASECLSVKNNTFRIYPADESETDRLITRALVLGDFYSAVELCLSAERYADALLLAIKGGEELLQRTQKAYFERQTTEHPYLRLFQSIVTNDLDDVVQNADLTEWAEVFVVLCTFASGEEFGGLAEQLGARLEFQAGVLRAESRDDSEDSIVDALELRRTATLTYLAAGRLERLVNIWIEELAEEEERRVKATDSPESTSRYATHAHALQTFIEKVTVFRGAVKYVDGDLSAPTEGTDGAIKTYKLAALYDRYFEYAEMLAAQGLIKEAVEYLKLTPNTYTGSALDFAVVRERLVVLSGQGSRVSSSRQDTVPNGGAAQKAPSPIYQPSVPAVPMQGGTYAPRQPIYTPAQPVYQHTQQAVPPSGSYTPAHPHVKPPSLGGPAVGPPIRPLVSNAPPPPRTQNGGWNDAPVIKTGRTPSSINVSKPGPIVAPFPNATQQSPPTPGTPFVGHGQNAPLPPPPRPSSVQNRPPPMAQARAPPQARSVSTSGQPPVQPPPHAGGAQYTSPSLGSVPLGQAPGPYVRATPPPGPPRGTVPPASQYARATPPPPGAGGATDVLQHPGPYAPPPSQASLPPQQQPGQYALPPSQAPQGPYGPPPSQTQGPYAPPSAQSSPAAYMPPPPQAHPQSGLYGPPPSSVTQGPPMQARGPPQAQHPLGGPAPQQHGPPPSGPSGQAPPVRAAAPPRGPPPPKYRK